MAREPKANRGPSAGPDNRRAIIAAARDVFGESGFAAPLSSIAKRAGVGQGSLYRHFPDRLALAVAVFDDNIADLEAIASDELTTLDDLFAAIAEQAMGSSALIDMFATHQDDPRTDHLQTRIVELVRTVLARDAAVGPHVTVDDVTLAIAMLAFALSRTDASAKGATAERARAMFRAAFGR
ncbi:MAG: helix-turn-helix domain-containing protein [Actinomycetota bacterium]